MEQIVQAISAKLGLPETAVRQGIGVLLNLLRQKASGTEFERFVSNLPGAEQFMASAPADPAASGAGGGLGGLGGLLGAAGGLLGGRAGELAKVLGSLQGAGISAGQAGPFAGEFLRQAKAVAGEETVSNLIASVPGLASILGKEPA